MKLVDIEDINRKVNSIINREFEHPSDEDALALAYLITTIIDIQSKKGHEPITPNQLQSLKNRYNCSKRNSYLMDVYERLIQLEYPSISPMDEGIISNALKIKRGKSHSGVIVLTVMLSPYPSYKNKDGEFVTQSFSCKYNCAYCPNDPSMPRSYLALEPSCLRGLEHNFDVKEQLWSRMNALRRIGHRTINKIEVIVEGGTWGSYPIEYRDEFVRDIYYALNVFTYQKLLLREPLSLLEEKKINQTANTRMSGLILETRPDNVTEEEILKLREYGCTRVQLGIQHIDQDVLDKNKRQCTTDQAKKAIRLLKDCGFKIDIHIMPNMYGSTLEKDKNMLIYRLLGTCKPFPTRIQNTTKEMEEIYELTEPDLQADHWKLYPCQVVPWTEIKTLYEAGEYVPYSESDLIDLLVTTKSLIFPWIRLNRCVRDIPSDYIYSSETGKGNLRNELVDIMKKDGTKCRCIRCKEVKEKYWDGKEYKVITRVYDSSKGKEYFISVESNNEEQLYGFIRLRLPFAFTKIFPELYGCALIRELHCYGNVLSPNTSNQSNINSVQHKGLGKLLLQRVQEIAKNKHYNKVAVISGEGVKEYYRKQGFEEDNGKGYYMVKRL